MTKVVHIIPVGLRKERLLESIRQSGYPIQKVYLVLGKDKKLSGEEEAYRAADEIEKTLNVLVEVEKIYVDKLDVYAAALDVLGVIKRELAENNEVLINASDSARTLCIACYVAAQLSGSRLYLAMPKYEDGGEVGIDKVVEIPIPPLKKISDDKLLVVSTIQEQGGEVESINKLIELLEGKTQDQKRYMAQRARMSYHLKGLEEDGLVEMRREGKNVKIKLTELGKAYGLMAD
jgi:DNA-binding transcriptional ArsR family regulator